MTAIGADHERELTPLEMAQNAAAAVARYAEYQGRDPLGSHINRAGEAGHQSAQLAGSMALVSIAQDLHRIVGIMTGQYPAGLREEP
jgi:hypothetical protein